MKATLDSQGRIQLPADVQQLLGVKPGDEVLLEPHADQCVIRRDEGSSALQWKGNVLVHRGTMRGSPETVSCRRRK